MEHLLEYALFITLGLLGTAPLLMHRKTSGKSGLPWVIVPTVGLSWMITGMILRPDSTDLQLQTAIPRTVKHDLYTGSKTCISCHQEQHKSWFASYHRTMTQVASPAAILADFDGRELKAGNTTCRIFMKGDQHWVQTPDPHWELKQDPLQIRNLRNPPMTEQRIVLVTGSHKMQMFWISLNHSGEQINPQEMENNTLWLFNWVYMVADKKWIPYEDSFIVDPSFGRLPAIWNESCIVCHSVRGQPKVKNERKPSFQTDVIDFGIACEACHGPGQQHVRTYQNPLTRYQAHLSDKTYSTNITNPLQLDQEKQTQVCGQCHSLFEAHDFRKFKETGIGFQPGAEITAHHDMLPLDRIDKNHVYYNMFWNDGTIRIGGREFQGLTKSECYLSGKMTCLSCHSIHSMQEQNDLLLPKMDSNHACVQCHSESQYQQDIQSHTHHAPRSDGSQCYNCHMPHTSYALMGGIRSHRIDEPRVSKVEQNEKPNACNLCHLDKPLQWTADYLTQWYGQESIELDKHHQETAAGIVWIMQGNAVHRTLAAWHMSWEPTQKTSGLYWRFPFLLQLLNDNYSATRYVTWESLNRIPNFSQLLTGENPYSFIAPASERTLFQQNLMNRWIDSMGAQAEQRSELLIRDGTLDNKTLLDLFEHRDDTKILMTE